MELNKRTIPQQLMISADTWPSAVAQYSKDDKGDFQPTTYPQLVEEMYIAAAGFLEHGIGRDDLVGLISENRKEWLLADLGLQALGAADVPRGNDTMPGELIYILNTVEARSSIFENITQLKKVLDRKKEVPHLKNWILFDEPGEDAKESLPDIESQLPRGSSLILFSSIMESGKEHLSRHREAIKSNIDSAKPEELATIIFTSGTTGEPKGVMISHWNFLVQALYIDNKIDISAGDTWLCVLPVWHSFERVMQYISIANGSALAYSKPVGPIMLADFAKVRPTWMASVPRIWESLQAGIYKNLRAKGGASWALFRFFVAVGGAYKYQEAKLRGWLPNFKKRSRILDVVTAFIPWLLLLPLQALGSVLVFSKIRAKLGGRFVAGISGGGALPAHIDKFFSAAGILLLEGYGLTETSPVISVRTQWSPVQGTIGSPLRYTEAQVRDENGKVLPPGHKGVLWVRGMQRMIGYYKRPDLTEQMIDGENWLNTGDLAEMTHNGEIAIRGRAKDTVVLLGGENIEPTPIEAKLRSSSYIDFAVVVGQDQKYLGALIVPNRDNVIEWAGEQGIPGDDWETLATSDAVRSLLKFEIAETVNSKNGFRTWEQISRFTVLPGSFEVGKELSGKQDLKRHYISDAYAKEIRELFE
ncbi:AMP-dependent synthetase/ligase [Salinispira pacifica]|uniref:Long-chain-fatty-acid--CoA ligase n=1 Tax=Salinispira pacifica TaxID=1307761 RepID=V5WKH1_9SPIO|nr:AMP-binding protein [Salinispira pacifica]AHC16140.1 Long-chain-fatty-acid--CoA ligase [Salinispira pacifica]